MKKIYSRPEIIIAAFNEEDVIRTSGANDDYGNDIYGVFSGTNFASPKKLWGFSKRYFRKKELIR